MTHIKTAEERVAIAGAYTRDDMQVNTATISIAKYAAMKEEAAELRAALSSTEDALDSSEAKLEQAQKRIAELEAPLSESQIASACLSYRHDFGLLDSDKQKVLILEAKEWYRAFGKQLEAQTPAQPATLINGLTQEQTDSTMSVKGLSQSAQPAQDPARPDIIEKLSYHKFERDDLTLDDCLTYLRTNGWHEVHGRNERQMILQMTELLAQQPAQEPVKQAPTFDELTKLLMQAATKEGHKVTMKIKWAQPATQGE